MEGGSRQSGTVDAQTMARRRGERVADDPRAGHGLCCGSEASRAGHGRLRAGVQDACMADPRAPPATLCAGHRGRT
eukprot:2800071-Rhodomonas_salina.1